MKKVTLNNLKKVIKVLKKDSLSGKKLEECIETLDSGYEELKKVQWHSEHAIIWEESDFEERAKETEELAAAVSKMKPKMIYDRKRFSYACKLMIQNHDCNNGITWETVDDYLDTYCVLPEEKLKR